MGERGMISPANSNHSLETTVYRPWLFLADVRSGQKSHRTIRVSPGVLFLRIFRALFPGDGDQEKFTKNPRHFSVQNPQANSKKESPQKFSGERAK